jgi:hypothetical protein
MYCASVVYPVDAGGFDFDYFARRHAPMFADPEAAVGVVQSTPSWPRRAHTSVRHRSAVA